MFNKDNTEWQEPILYAAMSGGNQNEIELPVSDYEVIKYLYDTGLDIPNKEHICYIGKCDNSRKDFNLVSIDTRGSNLYELNYLAQRLSEFDEYQDMSFKAYQETHGSQTIKQLINASLNIDQIIVYPIKNDYELGEFVLDNEMIEEYNNLPDKIYDMLDEEKIGKRFRKEEGGSFVKDGYMLINEFDEIYDGITLPNKESLSPIRIYVDNICEDISNNNNDWLELPAASETINEFAQKFQVTDIQELFFHRMESTIPHLSEICNNAYCNKDLMLDFDVLNDIAKSIKEMDYDQFIKAKAVLETINSVDLSEINQVIKSIDQADEIDFDESNIENSGMTMGGM